MVRPENDVFCAQWPSYESPWLLFSRKYAVTACYQLSLSSVQRNHVPVTGGWCETCSVCKTLSPAGPSHLPINCSPRNGLRGFFSLPCMQPQHHQLTFPGLPSALHQRRRLTVSFSRRVNCPESVEMNHLVTSSWRSSAVLPPAIACSPKRVSTIERRRKLGGRNARQTRCKLHPSSWGTRRGIRGRG